MAQWVRIHLQCRRQRRLGFNPWVGKIPWRKKWQPTPLGLYLCIRFCVFLIILGMYQCLGVELLGHTTALCLKFEEMPVCFPEWVYHFTLPSAVYENPRTLHPHQHLLLPVPLIHLSGCGWISHYSFDLYFPCGQCCSASFYVLLGHWHVFFRKMSVQIFDLLKLDYLSFYYWVIRVLMYSKWAQILSRVWLFAPHDL